MSDENSRDAWVYRRESVSELRECPEAELERRHDWLVEYLAGTDPFVTPVNVRQDVMSRIEVFSRELARRETVRLTRSLNRLTWAIAIATFIGVALTAWTLLSGA